MGGKEGERNLWLAKTGEEEGLVLSSAVRKFVKYHLCIAIYYYSSLF
jgi:hypothetical protein